MRALGISPAMIGWGLLAMAIASGVGHPSAVARCDNASLENHTDLLVIVPHPDDGVLGFAGLIDAYIHDRKPVTVIVVTDGDGACGACRFWKNDGGAGSDCTSADLAVFGSLRDNETREAMALLGKPRLRFLNYPDQGIAAAWKSLSLGHGHEFLRRRDCRPGYLGPPTPLTAQSLADALSRIVRESSVQTLIATTDPQAGHPDHAALGKLIAEIDSRLSRPRTLIFGLIHSPRIDGTECSYPAPTAPDCACDERVPRYFIQKPGLLARLRAFRYHPQWPAAVPPHFTGAHLQLCVARPLWDGAHPIELLATQRFGTQIGTVSRDGRPIPASERGWADCLGYLTAFVRRTELFWPARLVASKK